MTARFGPAGGSDSFAAAHNSTLDAPAWLAERNLNALEVQFGRGVRMGEKTARKLGELARQYDIALSVHTPYFISLSSPEPEKQAKNLKYIEQSARAAAWMGAAKAVVHTGSVMGLSRKEALGYSAAALCAALTMLEEMGLGDITLCVETMGKNNQLGDLDEVLALCVGEPRLRPCIDFGHLYARSQGGLVTYNDFAAVLDALELALGSDKAHKLHVHFSQMQYSKGGEIKHLKYGNGQFGPPFEPLAQLFAERGYAPTVICESDGTQAEDAALMRDLFTGFKSASNAGF